MNRMSLAVSALASIFVLAPPSLAQTVGPPIHFRATDVVVPAPSSDVLHLTMDVYVEVPNGPIDATAFGMLFNVLPNGAPVALIDATEPAAIRPPIFPLDQTILEFVSPAASGDDGAAIGLYSVAGENVSLEPGEYGLFTLHVDVAPNTVGTFDLVFGTDENFNGLVGNTDDGFIIYPNAEGSPAVLASITIVPEPSAWTLATVAALTAGAWRWRRRRSARAQTA